jgi:cytochrome c553
MEKENKMRNTWLMLPTIGLLILTGCGGSNGSQGQGEQNTKDAAPAAIKVTNNAVDTKVKKEKSKENGGQFYYAYNEEGKSKEAKEIDKYASQTSKTKTTIDAYLHIKSPYERVRITMMIKRLSKDYIIRCSPCHDDYANGVIGPSLLDKNATFIYGRIQDFKTGRKKNPLMKELVEQIDDAKLKQMAAEIASFNKEIRKMRSGK